MITASSLFFMSKFEKQFRQCKYIEPHFYTFFDFGICISLFWRRPIYVVLKTFDLQSLEDVCKRMSLLQSRSDVYTTSKEMIFLILYCLRYSEHVSVKVSI